MSKFVTIRRFGLYDYMPIWEQMRHFTDHRHADSKDELWLVEHYPVFTLGQRGKPEHLLKTTDIPVIHTDRGGQITYHGPGQLLLYPLINCRRKNLGVRPLVTILENSIMDLLVDYDIQAQVRKDAPGVYVNSAKIASVGLRIRKGNCYHGIALNVAMDLEPFSYINPCGIKDLGMTQLADYKQSIKIDDVAAKLVDHLCNYLGYNA